ncbi:hypothetical protein Tco_0002325 [Tanacetum coccineum]
MDITALGTKGNFRVHDFVIPFNEKVGAFYAVGNSRWAELSLGCVPEPSEFKITTDLPQESLMALSGSRRMMNELLERASLFKYHGPGARPKRCNFCRQSFITHLLQMMYSWVVVCDVWYLEPQKIKPREAAIQFAERFDSLASPFICYTEKTNM